MSPKNSGKIIKSVNEGKAWDWGELLSELKQGNDRATAILGGVFLDEQLRELLADVLIEDKNLDDELFGVEKPLSNFSARIKIAYAVGLLSKEIYKDLNTIRNVRNTFAHTLHGISFEHPDIKALCTELKIPAIAIPLLMQDVEPRDLYTMAVIQIIQYFFQKKFLKKQNRFTILIPSPVMAR